MLRSLSLFDIAFRILLIFLPFNVIISVFTAEELHIPGVTYIKEILLLFMGGYILWMHFSTTHKIRFHAFDILLFGYILVLIVITLFTTGKTGLLYGGRYDFEFLLAFIIMFHGARFLGEQTGYYIRLFLISGGISLFLSLLVRFVFHPDILLYFGFSGNPSNWEFSVAPPIFHGVEGANVQRFQGILDGPNSMGAFLIIYAGIFAYYMRKKPDWYFIVGVFLMMMLGLEFLTYSRSALGGFILGALIIFLFSFRSVYKKHKKELLFVGIIALCGFAFLGLQYYDKAEAILAREGSSKGHFQRMITGLERFREHPLGQGLGSAGPAYRYVLTRLGAMPLEIKEKEPYYIPESWYVQQLVEGGVLGFLFFASFFLLLAYRLFREHIILFAVFFGICTMNLVLHTFEVTYLSIWIFILFGMILGKRREVAGM